MAIGPDVARRRRAAAVLDDLGCSRNPDRVPHWFTTAYFHHPSELPDEASAAGLDCVEVVGVEGAAGWFRNIFDQWDGAAQRDAILFAARAIEAEPSLIGASTHLLMVAKRSPR